MNLSDQLAAFAAQQDRYNDPNVKNATEPHLSSKTAFHAADRIATLEARCVELEAENEGFPQLLAAERAEVLALRSRVAEFEEEQKD